MFLCHAKQNRSRFFKQIVCFVLLLAMVFSLVGCTNGDGTTTKDGKYFDKNGRELTGDEVTVDVVAQAHYSRYFNSCKSEQRKDVVYRYLKYHAPGYDFDESLVDSIFALDIPWSKAKSLDNLNDGLGKQENAIKLVGLYASARGQKDLGKFTEKLGKVTAVAGTVSQVGYAVAAVLEMSNKDVSDPDAYCKGVITALKAITSFTPVFGDYFSESLDVIEDGLSILIHDAQMKEVEYAVYSDEIDLKGHHFFSATISHSDTNPSIRYDFIVDPNEWEDGPTLEQVAKRSDAFSRMSQIELECVEAYILYRLYNKRDTEGIEELLSELYESTGTTEPAVPSLPVTGTTTEPTQKPTTPPVTEPITEPTTEPTIEPTQPPLEMDLPATWVGFGGTTDKLYCELTVEKMGYETIQGHFVASKSGQITHESDFEGTATKINDGAIKYAIVFEVPLVRSDATETYEVYEMDFTYYREYDRFHTDYWYSSEMYRRLPEAEQEILVEDVLWSATGECNFCNGYGVEHQMTLFVERMTENQITGTLTVYGTDGSVEYTSAFTGWGCGGNDGYSYEVAMEVQRHQDAAFGLTRDFDYFILSYRENSDKFSIPFYHPYNGDFFRAEESTN